MAEKKSSSTAWPDQLLVDRQQRPLTPPLTLSFDSSTASNSGTPPSPPPPLSNVNAILAELRARQRGHPRHRVEWWTVRLNPDEFRSLLVQVRADPDLRGYFEDKVKYDYLPQEQEFVLRLGTPLHEYLVREFEYNIRRQLDSIAQGPNQLAARFAQEVRGWGSPHIKLEGASRHCPDGSLSHCKTSDPAFVLEVSYSQKQKSLRTLADDYILGSDGTIHVVVGIDIEYRESKGKTAKIFVWRPNLFEEDGNTIFEVSESEYTFRAKDGSLINGDQKLNFPLRDFADSIAFPEISGLQGSISISCSDLYSILEQAEKIHFQTASQNQKRRRTELGPAGPIIKRPRQRTPPEELRDEDEKRFQKQEAAAERIAEKDDSSYSGDSQNE